MTAFPPQLSLLTPRMTAQGHEDRFPPPRLSAGFGFSKETSAEMRRNGQDAPELAVTWFRKVVSLTLLSALHWQFGTRLPA